MNPARAARGRRTAPAPQRGERVDAGGRSSSAVTHSKQRGTAAHRDGRMLRAYVPTSSSNGMAWPAKPSAQYGLEAAQALVERGDEARRC